MQAASQPSQRGTSATAPIQLRVDVFDRRTEELGAKTETEKADMLDTDRKTLWRYRERKMTPKLDLAMRWAEQLDLTVEDLWERVA